VLAAGMNDHIAKPIVVSEMFATLAKWVKPTRPVSLNGSAAGQMSSGPNGIDTLSGLANTGGDHEFYRRMLVMFREREADFLQRFHAAREQRDAEAAMRNAHDLKSEASTLGMHGLERAAAALEQGCLDASGEADVDGMLHEVSSKLHEVMDELRALESMPLTQASR